MKTVTARGISFVAFAALALGGCASLPDVGPFVEATTEVRSAVNQAGITVEAELRRMEGGESSADKLKAQWSTRVGALSAMVSYSESLQTIVSAGQQGAQSVEALADSATKLANAAGIAVPVAGAAGQVVEIAKTVYREIALMRAAKSLEEALERSRRPVEEIAAIIGEDIADLKVILQAASDEITGNLEIDHQVGLEFRDALLVRRDALYAIGADRLTAAQKGELMEVDGLIASTNEWYAPLQHQLNEARARLSASESLVDAASAAVRQWGLAYSNLVLAVKERRPVSTQSLAAAAIDIRDLTQRIREQ